MYLRPKSIAAAVAEIAEFGDFTASSRSFLDEFYIAPQQARQAMLEETPQPLPDPRWDAWWAAAAEHLATEYGLRIPTWTSSPSRFLHRAWFPCGLESLKALCIAESPTAFRRRMIFVDSNPLYRPRKTQPVASFMSQA